MNYRIDLAVIEQQENYSRFGLTLHNLSDQDLQDWSIHVSFRRYIQPQTLTQGLIEQIGGYCVFTPPTNTTLQANNLYYVEFGANTSPFKLLDDGFDDAFIQVVQDNQSQTLRVAVTPIALSTNAKKQITVPNVEAKLDSLIPAPQSMKPQAGYFNLDTAITFQAHSSYAQSALVWLADELSQITQHPIKKSTQGNVCFVTTQSLPQDAYKLEIQPNQILLEASSSSGFMYAAVSLLQLISIQIDHDSQQLACVLIQDKPRFDHRGMMLDCARHFHSVEQIKRLINQLAKYKFNTFHWHLTDDEGWRIEIKAFPELTEIGAWRGINTPIEPQYSHLAETYGGFYSQDQIREIVSYAAERNISVIPELDIPGHCRAAIKSLPHLLVDPDDRSQYRSIQYYVDNVLSPGLAGTYTFLDTVLEEISQLFPSPLVHIGGDEVPEGVWTNSPKCQELMKAQGYSEPKELQGHILRYAEDKLKSLGKRMLGWEEVQHGNKVSKDTIICSWISEDAGLQAIKQGVDIVLQPAQFTYLDIVQDYSFEELGVNWAGVTPLEKSYGYEPLAQVASDDPIRQHILGIQCGLWCEIIDTPERMDTMIFPRLLAIAEVCWSEKQNRNWIDFVARLNGHLPTLNRQGIKYRPLN